MNVGWRTAEKPLHSHGAWRRKIDKKNRETGTSAPTLAAAWAGPVEVMGALQDVPVLAGLRISEIAVEARSAVDEHQGDRNHDLVVAGELESGERVVVCVEAKAGEDLAETIKDQRATAKRLVVRAAKVNETISDPAKRTSSFAEVRLAGLLERFLNATATDEAVQDLRYQLLTALAGTISEAASRRAQHAVLMVHEFLTDERDRLKVLDDHLGELRAFTKAVFGVRTPGIAEAPWCFPLPARNDAPGLNLYLAYAVTDLRTAALKHRSVNPALAKISDEELIERADQGDQQAAAELAGRGVKPPSPGPEPPVA